MEIIQERQDQIEVFRVRGRLDSNTSPQLEEQLNLSLDKGATQMVIDFEDLEYISSAGIRVILKTVKKLEHSQGKLILCALQDYVQEVFEIAGFDTYLTLEPTREKAVASWRETLDFSGGSSPHTDEPLFAKGTQKKGD